MIPIFVFVEFETCVHVEQVLSSAWLVYGNAQAISAGTMTHDEHEATLVRSMGQVVSLRSALALRNVPITLGVLGMARRSKEFTTLPWKRIFSPVYCSDDSAVLCADEHKTVATSTCYIRFNRREWLGLVEVSATTVTSLQRISDLCRMHFPRTRQMRLRLVGSLFLILERSRIKLL